MFIYLWYNALFWHHLSKEKDINKKYVIIYHNNYYTPMHYVHCAIFFKTCLQVTVYILLLVSDTNVRIYYELLTTLTQ